MTTQITQSNGGDAPEGAVTHAWEQACRQRWRALALSIKAKLESVESGIEEFESAFMAQVVMPNGKTIEEEVRPVIAQALRDRQDAEPVARILKIKSPLVRFCHCLNRGAVSENPGLHRALAVAGIRDLQIPGETVVDPVQFLIGTTRKDFYVGTADLAGVLGVTANELSQLHRLSILERIPDPRNKKAVLYPVFDSIRKYCEYRRTKRLAVHEKFLEEKAGREKAQRLAIEMTNRQRGGELVDKQKLISRLEPVVIAFRESLLARTDRLVGELSQTKSRNEKVRRLREADIQSLHVLSDLFIRAGKGDTAGNGAKAKTF